MGQRYGDLLLPAAIPEDEFDAIHQLAVEDHQNYVTAMAEMVARMEEKKRQEAERKAAERAAKDGQGESQSEASLSPVSKTPHLELENTTAATTNPNANDVPSYQNSESSSPDGKRVDELMSSFKESAESLGKEAVFLKTIQRESSMYKERLSNDVPDPGILRQWYILDKNSVPPVYRLQKIRLE